MRTLATLCLVLIACITPAHAQTFQQPSAAIRHLITTSPPPTPLVHASSGQLALLQEEQLIGMERLLAPRLGLAGFRFDPVTRISGIEPMVIKVEILATGAAAGSIRKTWQPAGNARLTDIQFSPDGRYLSALQVSTGQPTRLVLFDIATAQTRVLSDRINAAWNKPCLWADNHRLLCRFQPDDAVLAKTEIGPITLEHQGKPLPSRTYSNLLETPQDDAQFSYYFSSAPGFIDLQGKREMLSVTPGLINHLALAPDSRFILLRRLQPPFPRTVAASQFPSVIEVWDRQQKDPLYRSPAMGFGIETQWMEQADPASIQWAPQSPAMAGFLFREEQDNGRIEYQWRALPAPFTQAPTVLARSPYPIREFAWTSAGTPLLVTNTEEPGVTSIQIILNNGVRELWRGDRKDRYQAPGKAIRVDGASGPILEAQGAIFVASPGLSESGSRPYLDRIDLHNGQTRRLFTAEAGHFETVLAVLDPQREILLTQRESETTPPAFVSVGAGKVTTLWQTENPYPELNAVERRQISYPRQDGVTLSATLYLPAGKSKQPLPTLIWIYPREFDDPQQAEQLDSKPFQFHRIKGPSPIAAVLAGYAVLVNPTVPIISTAESEDEAYLPQLVSSAEAAVDYLVQQHISDAKRIAIGGRSYGAFSTANLLIHSNRFASGIAMSGAYNRTLTPFGFQHEKRTFWQETDYYTSISPFFHADQIKRPLLLVHGGADPNPGTPKLQARRLYHALSGEGKTVRYVELPGEEHHYRGEATVLHATWEMIDWLDRTIGPKVAR